VSDPEIQALVDRAIAMKDGAAKLKLLEEGAQRAEILGDLTLTYFARQHAMRVAYVLDELDRALVAFAWCRALADRESRFDDRFLLSMGPLLADSIDPFPQIPRARAEAAYEDLIRRYRAHGRSLRPIYRSQCSTALAMGRLDEAAAAYDAWMAAPPDDSGFCAVCELSSRVRFLVDTGSEEEALALAAPILEGSQTCNTGPGGTLARSLRPLIRLGRWDEARRHHAAGMALLDGERTYVAVVADHLIFVALVRQKQKGARLLERHLYRALKQRPRLAPLLFYMGAAVFLEGLEREGVKAIDLRLPKSFPGFEAEGHYEVGALKGWFADQIEDLGGRFDRRNGNTYYRDQMRSLGQIWSLQPPRG
jgi:tetratricopeptide (TPR) repeat protein